LYSLAVSEAANTIENTVQKYLGTLALHNIPVSQAYLFGSCVKGTQHKDSDIDIAIFWDVDEIEHFASDLVLLKLTRTIDLRIEPHSFSRQEIDNPDPFVAEILATGKRIDGQ
jgi:predicted nucleotidyltransferase